MPAVAGVTFATAAAGVRYKGRTDVLLMLLDPGTAVAGVFTRRNARRRRSNGAAPSCKGRKARALVVNSGNANAFTGKSGREACKFTAQIAARAAGCKPDDVFLASTGVIGEPLNASVFDGVMEGIVARARLAISWLRRARDHDHRHVPEGRDRDGSIGKATSRSTASPRAPA